MIVDRVGEMIRRYAVGFEKDDVLVVFGDLKRAFYEVRYLYLLLNNVLKSVLTNGWMKKAV